MLPVIHIAIHTMWAESYALCDVNTGIHSLCTNIITLWLSIQYKCNRVLVTVYKTGKLLTRNFMHLN